MKSFIFLNKDGWTKAFQVSIGNDSGGYRIHGPDYNGSGKNIIKHEITERDALEIRKYLDLAFQLKVDNRRETDNDNTRRT